MASIYVDLVTTVMDFFKKEIDQEDCIIIKVPDIMKQITDFASKFVVYQQLEDEEEKEDKEQ